MEQNLTAQSFIVRVYRVDNEDRRKIAGLVEALDCSGRQKPFRDADELAGLLNNWSAASRKRVRKAKTGGQENNSDKIKYNEGERL
jgi:hypothetical protein